MVNLDNKLTTKALNNAVSCYHKDKCDNLRLHNSNNYGIYKLKNQKIIKRKRQYTAYYYFRKSIDKIPMTPNSYTTIYETRHSLKSSIIITRHLSKVRNEIKKDILSCPSKRKS